MKLKLIAVGTRMPGWVNEAYQDYANRMPADCALELLEIPLAPRTRKADTRRCSEVEGQRVLKAADSCAIKVLLDETGAAWSTRKLAAQMEQWRSAGGDVALLVGGPDGHGAAVRDAAQQRWSLSALTLPHAMVRVLLAEALYRAWSVLANHPYHRA